MNTFILGAWLLGVPVGFFVGAWWASRPEDEDAEQPAVRDRDRPEFGGLFLVLAVLVALLAVVFV